MSVSPKQQRWVSVIALATCTWASLAPADEPVPRFACSFDHGLAAESAGGRAEPVSRKGVEQGPGVRGQAVHLADGDGPVHLAYAAAGNMDFSAGTIDFHVQLDWDYTQSTSRAKRNWFNMGTWTNRNRLYLHSQSGSLVFGIIDDAGVAHVVYGSSITAWRSGQWHRVTCTWDLARRYMALAVDGGLESDSPSRVREGSWRVVDEANTTIHFGAKGNTSTPLGGTIDELRILDTPLRFRTQAGPARPLAPDELNDLRRQAAQALAELEQAIRQAEREGIDVSYAEAVATTSHVGMWRLSHSPIKPQPDEARAYSAYVTTRGRAAWEELARLVGDRTREKRVLRQDVFNLRVEEDAFRNAAGEEVLLIGMRNVDRQELAELGRFFNLIAWGSAQRNDWIAEVKRHGYAGQVHLSWSRQLPAALAEHPGMRNVGGWCGHNWTTDLCVEAARTRRLIAEKFGDLHVLRRAPDPSVAYALLSAEDEYMCWCATSIDLFRRWLSERYADIAALNQAWSTGVRSFDDVSPPRWVRGELRPDNRAAWYDWQQFNRARTTAIYAQLKSLVSGTWEQVPVCGGTHMSLADNRWGTMGVDPEGLNAGVNDVIQSETVYELPQPAVARDVPAYGMDLFAEAYLDFQRSTSNKPATDLEFHAWLRYADALRARHGKLPANYSYTAVLRHFLHGVRAANLWVWGRRPLDSEFPASFSASPVIPLKSVEESLRAALDVRRLSREIHALSRAPAEVAILVSDAAFMQIHPSFARSHVPSPLVAELDNVCHGSMFLDTPIGFVTERSIARGALARYRVVLIPAVSHLDDGTLAALLEFVERGGHLLVTPRSFAFNEHHRPRVRLDGFPKAGGITFVGLLAEPTPAQLADPEFVEKQSVNAQDPRVPGAAMTVTGDALRPDGDHLEGAGIRLALAAANGKVLARFDDDQAPAIVQIPRGAGQIVYCAIPLRPTSYARLLESILSEVEVSRPVRLESPAGEPVWGVEARSCQYEGDVLLYAINLLAAPVECRLTSRHPIVGVHDLIANAPGESVLRLAPLETVMLRLKIGS